MELRSGSCWGQTQEIVIYLLYIKICHEMKGALSNYIRSPVVSFSLCQGLVPSCLRLNYSSAERLHLA